MRVEATELQQARRTGLPTRLPGDCVGLMAWTPYQSGRRGIIKYLKHRRYTLGTEAFQFPDG